MDPQGASPRRLALTFLAIALALLAHQLVVREPAASDGWLLYAVAGLIIGAANGSRPHRRGAPTWTGPVVPRRRLAWGFAAVAAVSATVWFSVRGEHGVASLLTWLLSFGLASLAVRGSRLSPPRRSPVVWSRAEVVALLAILLVGAVARTIWIDQVPPCYFGDEPRLGIFVRDAFRQGFPNLFTTGWRTYLAEGPPTADWTMASMSMAVQAVFAPLLGLNTTTLRLSSSLVGTLTILTTYILARELFTPRIALLTGLLFACGRTAIDFSRIGIPYIQVTFFATLAFACWWRAVNRGTGAAYLWAGINLALCVTAYGSGMTAPLLWAGWAGLALLVAPRVTSGYWRGGLLTAFGFALTVSPHLLHITDCLTFGSNWQAFTMFLHERHVLGVVIDTWQTTGTDAAWRILRGQLVGTWLSFGVIPGKAYGFGYRGGGMLDMVSAPLFTLGLLLASFRLRSARYGFVLYVFVGIAVLGGVLTPEVPAVQRMTALLPALALLAAMPIDCALAAAPRRGATRVAALAGVAALLAGAAWDSGRTYFVEYPRDTQQASADVARHLAALPSDAAALLVGAERSLRFDDELFRLDFPGRGFANAAEPSQLLPLRTSPEAKVALIFAASQFDLADQAQALYPGTPITEGHGSSGAAPSFRAMLLSPETIAARQGLRLEILDPTGTVSHTAVADPFSPRPRSPSSCAEVRWSGSIYWPTDDPVSLTVRGGSEVSLAHRRVRGPGDRTAVRVAVQLPRGWQPLSIRERCQVAQALELSIEQQGVTRLILTRELRPDGAGEGLLASYESNGRPLLETVEPQLDYFSVENIPVPGGPEAAPAERLVGTPQRLRWDGLLRVDRPGTHTLEVESQGGAFFALLLDGESLLEQSVADPEQPQRVGVARELDEGLHPLAARWEASDPGTRRLFQLYWTPPESRRSLVPPTHLRRAERGGDLEPFPTLEVPPPPTPVTLAAGARLMLTEIEPSHVTFGFRKPAILGQEGNGSGASAELGERGGIAMFPWTRMIYPVPPNAVELEATVALSSSARWCGRASVRFAVRDARENLLYDSGVVRADTGPRAFRVRVAGTPTVSLTVTDAGDGFDCDDALWIEPAFVIR